MFVHENSKTETAKLGRLVCVQVATSNGKDHTPTTRFGVSTLTDVTNLTHNSKLLMDADGLTPVPLMYPQAA